MGYKASSFVRANINTSGLSIAATLPGDGVVGDVFTALVTRVSGSTVTDVSSANISWQFAEEFDHTANNQDFELWVGRCTTAFSANTESVTASFSTSVTWREIDLAGWEPEIGYEFPAGGYFVDGQAVTYAANSNPTTTDGFSTTPLLGDVNAKYLLIGIFAIESTTNPVQSQVSAGTNYTEHVDWILFDTAGCVGSFNSRLYDGSTNQAVLGTISVNCSFMTSLCGVAVKQTIQGTPVPTYNVARPPLEQISQPALGGFAMLDVRDW